MIDKDKFQSISEYIFKNKTVDDVVVYLSSKEKGLTRFSNNALSQNVSQHREEITIEAYTGKKKGSASTTSFNKKDLLTALRWAEEIALSSFDDPEFIPLLSPQKYLPIQGYSKAIENNPLQMRVNTAGKIINYAVKDKFNSFGSISHTIIKGGIANTRGLFAFDKISSGKITFTVKGKKGSAYTEILDADFSSVDIEEEYQRLKEKVKLSENPVDISPGKYTVILEPLAFSDLIMWFYPSLIARDCDEGRSAFSGKLGKKIGIEKFSLYSDSKKLRMFSFDNEGHRLKKYYWIKNGVLENLIYSRYWAKKKKRKSTGFPPGLIVDEGSSSLKQMIESTKKGVLLTRFWYIRYVNLKELVLTGMTRDGFFLIEGGKIVKGLKNMRFNESLLNVIRNITALGKQKMFQMEFSDGRIIAPAVKIENFNFASKTEF